MKSPELTLRKYIEEKLKELKKIRKFKLGEELWNTLYNLSVDYDLRAHNKMNTIENEAVQAIDAKLLEILNHYPYKKDKKKIELKDKKKIKLEDYIEFKVKDLLDKTFCLLKIEENLMICFKKGSLPLESNSKYSVRQVEVFFEKGEWIKIKQEEGK